MYFNLKLTINAMIFCMYIMDITYDIQKEFYVSNSLLAFQDPSIDGPILRFNNGIVVNGTEEYNSEIPLLDKLSSDWDLTEWSDGTFINPSDFTLNSNSDPIIGNEDYSWTSPGHESSLAVFGPKGDYTYRLTAENSTLQDTYLQSYVPAPKNYTFDNQITFTANERISNIVKSDQYTQIQNDEVVIFNVEGSYSYDPKIPIIVVWLQNILSSSRQDSGGYESWNPSENSLIFDVPSNPLVINPMQQLPWVATSGPLYSVSIDLNSSLTSMINYLVNNNSDGVSKSDLENLSKWSLAGFYAGVETSIGSGASLDIQHPIISRSNSEKFDISQASLTPVTIKDGIKNFITYNNVHDGNIIDTGIGSIINCTNGRNVITLTSDSVDSTILGDGKNILNINTVSGVTSIIATSNSYDFMYSSLNTTGDIFYRSADFAEGFITPFASNVTVSGSGVIGSETVWGGEIENRFSGRLTVNDGIGYFQGGSGGNNLINSSAYGISTLIGGGSNDVLIAKGVGDVLVGAKGQSTLDGSLSFGNVSFFTSKNGASLMYGSKTLSDTFYLNESTVKASGFVGAFFDLHTAPASTLYNLNTNVSNTIAVGFSGTGSNFGSVGDFISGLDKIVLNTASAGSTFNLTSGTVLGQNGIVTYTNFVTSNGSVITFYNTIIKDTDVTLI